MSILKCKMCGGDLNVAEGMSVCECEYCGTKQTVPAADDEKKITLFARANRLRFNNEFDKAAGVYESIVADFPEEAEAYWGLVLCQYGIEYVDDPATGKKIPTCHRSSFESVMDDNNFDLTLEYADPVARGIYREEAKQIEKLRRGIIAVSSKEEPYDIFICYKETDDKGERTIDSVIAQDVYTALTEKGYRVFFSRISLEDKLGVEYEPYIFAALHSAKVMLAIGTHYDYYTAVWVKNEWSRYLQLIAKGEKKTLIPCYKGIDAYDMPREFAKLQAQDMGKVGAMQDLLRGIEKILPTEAPVATASVAAPARNTVQLMLPDDVMYEGEVFAGVPHGHGRADYTNGDRYEGQWNRGKREGLGKIIWDEGGEWVGEFNDDEPWAGNGTYYFDSDTWHGHGHVGCYEGEFSHYYRHGYGKFSWDNGDIYEGQWQSGKRIGQGKMIWIKGGEWVGEFHDDKPWNGNGAIHIPFDNGKTLLYEGEYRNGKRNGQGTLHYDDSVFIGTWVDDIRQGQGKMIWNEGGEWVGEFKDNKSWNGRGTDWYSNGYYIGNLVNGLRQGQGKWVWNKGGEWVGEFKDGEFWNGRGTVWYKDCYYIGNVVNGLRQGQGKMVWNEGGEWVGEYKDDKFWNGRGTVWHTDGYYIGNLVNGLRQGQGKFVWNEGGEWVGEFKDNKSWNGRGTWWSSDGYYIGNVVNGLRQGQGKFVWNKGGEWVGEYKDDKRWNGRGTIYYTDGTSDIVVTKRGKSR